MIIIGMKYNVRKRLSVGIPRILVKPKVIWTIRILRLPPVMNASSNAVPSWGRGASYKRDPVQKTIPEPNINYIRGLRHVV